MSERFFEQPILNSPYEVPQWHHPRDENGQPTGGPPIHRRRKSDLITPVPKSKKQKGNKTEQTEFVYGKETGIGDTEQQHNPTPIFNKIRQRVERSLELPNPEQLGVTHRA